jgi:hypothetical protein
MLTATLTGSALVLGWCVLVRTGVGLGPPAALRRACAVRPLPCQPRSGREPNLDFALAVARTRHEIEVVER